MEIFSTLAAVPGTGLFFSSVETFACMIVENYEAPVAGDRSHDRAQALNFDTYQSSGLTGKITLM